MLVRHSHYQDGDGLCFCPNTCPTEEQRKVQDAIINADADREAAALVQTAAMLTTV